MTKTTAATTAADLWREAAAAAAAVADAWWKVANAAAAAAHADATALVDEATAEEAK